MPQLLLCLALALLSSSCGSLDTSASAERAGETALWPAYGGSDNADHYSQLTEINRDNVDQLELAWSHRSGDFSDGSAEWTITSLQVTPIVINKLLYYCTPFGRVFALDPETGAERWSYDPGVRNKRSGLYPAICRGVSYWEADLPEAGKPCQKRIIHSTRDAQLLALDADTGQLCTGFGRDGKVALKDGIDGALEWEYYATSPAYISGDIAVLGAFIPDNDRVDVPSGVVRAFDVRSGEQVWAWEPVSHAYRDSHRDHLGKRRYHLGSPNVWAPISGDEARGLIFVPTGNPSPDLYGGNREGIDDYGSSVVALHAASGEVAWHFQTVHHDVWDYDVASQPGLFQIQGVGGGRPGIAQATKTGHIFLLDRESGQPMYPVEERPVPQGGAPGETLSATQPFPTHPKPLHQPSTLQEADIDGFAVFDTLACRRELKQFRSEGIFTPPSLQGSVTFPSSIGGMNWGGIAIDPVNGVLYANQTHIASVVQLIPRAEYDRANPVTDYPIEYYPMRGTPYGVKRFSLLSPLGAPCNPRPWGSLTAVDLKTGAPLWKKTLGTSRGQAPWPLWFDTGSPNQGGSLVTAGGLVFIAATTDGYFRAFDARSGDELWRETLPFNGHANPMTYRLGANSRQFVVIAAGGHGWSATGDTILAFALPNRL